MRRELRFVMSKILAVPPAQSQLQPVSGRSGLPGVGHVLEYIRDPLALMQKHWDRYGEVSWFSMVGRRWVAVLGPDACQEVLQNKDRAFVNGDGWSVLIGPFFHASRIPSTFSTRRSIRRSTPGLPPTDSAPTRRSRRSLSISPPTFSWVARKGLPRARFPR